MFRDRFYKSQKGTCYCCFGASLLVVDRQWGEGGAPNHYMWYMACTIKDGEGTAMKARISLLQTVVVVLSTVRTALQGI